MVIPAFDRASKEYKNAFWAALRDKFVVQSVYNALNVGTDSEGGYLVPDEFERTLVQALEENNFMRQISRRITTSGGELRIPVVATRGEAAWTEEEAVIPESDNTFSQTTLSAYKLTTLVKVSQELLQDSAFPLESFLAEDFARRMGVKEEEAFISGDGDKKPTGFLQDAVVAKTAAGETAITFDEVMDIYFALKSPYRSRAVFIANEMTVKALRQIKDTNSQYIWQPAVSAGTPDMLLGRPVYTSPFVPVMAAGAKALVFGDFSYYWIGDRQGRRFERLNELFSLTDQVGFKATQRVDGKLILPEAVQVLKMAVD